MTDCDRVTELEIRITHLEDHVDQLTRSLLELERSRQEMQREIDTLRDQLRAQTSHAAALRPEEDIPPHY